MVVITKVKSLNLKTSVRVQSLRKIKETRSPFSHPFKARKTAKNYKAC